MPTNCTPRGPYSRLSETIRSSTAWTYGQWLQMNMTTRTGLSRKSSHAWTLPSTEGSRKSGHGAPSAISQLSVSAMRSQLAPRATRGNAVSRRAPRRLGELVDGEALPPGLAPQLGVLDRLLEAPMGEHVGPGVEEDAVAREAVAARAADLLVVALDRAGHLAVDHVADVRLVDAHPEGDRRHHDVDLVAREGVLVARPHGVLEAGVVRHGAHSGGVEELGQGLDVLPGQHVDDAALARAPADVGEEVLARPAAVALLVRREHQVRAEERALEPVGLHHAELADDVAGHPAGGGGGEREDRDAAELVLEPAQAAVCGTEVVAPLRDAVRLVDHDERHAHPAEEAPEPALEPLGRHVDELVLARREPAEAVAARLPVERRLDDRGAEAVAREPVHLVLHERDERAHHEDGARQETRRDLDGARLASAGRHDADAVPPAQDRVGDLLLSRAEALVAHA